MRNYGDRTREILASIGITKDKYVEWKETVGLPAQCDCDMRRDWLNTVPDAFVEGGWKAAKEAAEKIRAFYDKPR